MLNNLEANLSLLKAKWGNEFNFHDFDRWVQGHLIEIDFAAYDLLWQCWNVAYLRGVADKERDLQEGNYLMSICG